MNPLGNKIITVLSVSFRSEFHLSRLFNNLIDKAEQPKNIQFLVVDNTNGEDTELMESFSSDLDITIIPNDGRNLQRSISHASALDVGLGHAQTEYTLLVDPDVHIFKSGWDSFCLEKLQENEKTVIGAPYPVWKLGKVHDYPSVVFMFFKTDLVKAFGKTFHPFPSFSGRIWNSMIRKTVRLGIITSKLRLDKSEKLRSISGWLEKITGITGPDTGKEIIEMFHKQNFDPVNFIAPYSTDLAEKDHDMYFEMAKEYELFLYNNEPMMTHMYSSEVFHWKTERGSDFDYWQKLIAMIEDQIK